MMAELYGKVTGTCRGRGGSMHIADFSLGMLGANGIVGGGFALAAGAALAAQFRGTSDVTLCFFGDGAINKGTFHEALNFAAVRKLPVIFLCENNQFAQYTAVERTTAVRDLASRAARLRDSRRRGRRQRRARRRGRHRARRRRARAAARGRASSSPIPIASTGTMSARRCPIAARPRSRQRQDRRSDPALRDLAAEYAAFSTTPAARRSGTKTRARGRGCGPLRAGERRPRSGDGARRSLRRHPRRLEHRADALSQHGPGDQRRDARRDAPRPDRHRPRPGHPLGRVVRPVPRPLRGVRRPRDRHADLGIDDRRGGVGAAATRPAPGGVDELRRVLDGGDGRAGQPGGQAPLHVRRPGRACPSCSAAPTGRSARRPPSIRRASRRSSPISRD